MQSLQRHGLLLDSSRALLRTGPPLRFAVRPWRTQAVQLQQQQQLQERSAPELVDRVLELVQDKDGGVYGTIPDSVKAEVDGLLDQLEEIGRAQQPRPNKSELLWGNYNVAYTSTRRAPTERGEPAGGRFRNPVGRFLFSSTGLFQSCLQPDLCVNKVAFRLFGFLAGYVALRGKILPLEDTGDHDTVRVRFSPTVVSFGDLHLRLGKPSQVQLTTTYLDERVRLGKGSRGSLFVFTRGGPADEAGMEAVGTQTTPTHVRLLAAAAYTAVMLGALGVVLAGAVHPVLRGLAGAVALLGGLLGTVLRNGGVDDDDQSAQMEEKYWKEYEERQAARQAAQQQQQQQRSGGGADGSVAAPAAAA